jgi:hypothetical protein
MSLALAVLFTLLLSAESLWMFALSAHVAPFMETAAPLFWLSALAALWSAYARARRRALPVLAAGAALLAVGAGLGAIAILSA